MFMVLEMCNLRGGGEIDQYCKRIIRCNEGSTVASRLTWRGNVAF